MTTSMNSNMTHVAKAIVKRAVEQVRDDDRDESIEITITPLKCQKCGRMSSVIVSPVLETLIKAVMQRSSQPAFLPSVCGMCPGSPGSPSGDLHLYTKRDVCRVLILLQCERRGRVYVLQSGSSTGDPNESVAIDMQTISDVAIVVWEVADDLRNGRALGPIAMSVMMGT